MHIHIRFYSFIIIICFVESSHFSFFSVSMAVYFLQRAFAYFDVFVYYYC